MSSRGKDSNEVAGQVGHQGLKVQPPAQPPLLLNGNSSPEVPDDRLGEEARGGSVIGPRLSTDLQQTNRPAPSFARKSVLSAPASGPGWQRSWEAPRASSEGRSGDALSWPPHPHTPLKRVGTDLGPSHCHLSPTRGPTKWHGGPVAAPAPARWGWVGPWGLPSARAASQTSHSLPCSRDLPPSCFPNSQSSRHSQAWLPHCLYSHLTT